MSDIQELNEILQQNQTRRGVISRELTAAQWLAESRKVSCVNRICYQAPEMAITYIEIFRCLWPLSQT